MELNANGKDRKMSRIISLPGCVYYCASFALSFPYIATEYHIFLVVFFIKFIKADSEFISFAFFSTFLPGFYLMLFCDADEIRHVVHVMFH